MLACSEYFSNRLSTQALTLEERKEGRKLAESQDEEKNKAEPRIQFSLQCPKALCGQSDHLLGKLILPCC